MEFRGIVNYGTEVEEMVYVNVDSKDAFVDEWTWRLFPEMNGGVYVYNHRDGKVHFKEYNGYGDDCDPGEYNDYITEAHEFILEEQCDAYEECGTSCFEGIDFQAEGFATPNDYYAYQADLPFTFKRNEEGLLEIDAPIED